MVQPVNTRIAAANVASGRANGKIIKAPPRRIKAIWHNLAESREISVELFNCIRSKPEMPAQMLILRLNRVLEVSEAECVRFVTPPPPTFHPRRALELRNTNSAVTSVETQTVQKDNTNAGNELRIGQNWGQCLRLCRQTMVEL